MESFASGSLSRGLPLVEDVEALGAGAAIPTAVFGAVGTLSFNGNKLITTGGGGADHQ